MLYCKDCQESHGLQKPAFKLYYESCDLCKKPITTCYFTMEKKDGIIEIQRKGKSIH